jgi:acyl-CoA synthetase (AMP-forming)/AMP-acid ligase II
MFNDRIDFSIQRTRIGHGIPPDAHQVSCSNIGDLLKLQVEKHDSKTWLIFYSDVTGRHEYSYREFYEPVCKTANFLINQGIRYGDRIATVAFNHSDTVIQYFASWSIGAVVVPINVCEDDNRIGFVLQNAQSKLTFVQGQFIERRE